MFSTFYIAFEKRQPMTQWSELNSWGWMKWQDEDEDEGNDMTIDYIDNKIFTGYNWNNPDNKLNDYNIFLFFFQVHNIMLLKKKK